MGSIFSEKGCLVENAKKGAGIFLNSWEKVVIKRQFFEHFFWIIQHAFSQNLHELSSHLFSSKNWEIEIFASCQMSRCYVLGKAYQKARKAVRRCFAAGAWRRWEVCLPQSWEFGAWILLKMHPGRWKQRGISKTQAPKPFWSETSWTWTWEKLSPISSWI